MAELLIRTFSTADRGQGNPDHFWKKGDVVAVHEDSGAIGTRSNYKLWVARGNTPEDWPGKMVLVRFPSRPRRDFLHLVDQDVDVVPAADGVDTVLRHKRKHSFDYEAIERRAEGSIYEEGHPKAGQRRDTLRAEHWIERNPGDADVVAAQTLKRPI